MKKILYYFILIAVMVFQQAIAATATAVFSGVEVVAQGELFSHYRGGRSINFYHNRQQFIEDYPQLESLQTDFESSTFVVVKMKLMGGSPQAYVSIGEAYVSQGSVEAPIKYLNIPLVYNFYTDLSNAGQLCSANGVLNYPYIVIKVPSSDYQLIRFEEKRQAIDCNK